MNSFLLVGIGGALGAMARYGFAETVTRFWRSDFPLATLFINIIGSVAMGVVMALLGKFAPSWSNEARLFLAVGVLGGFTTFSSFSLDSIRLIEAGQIVPAVTYVVLSVVICLMGLYLGALLVRMSVP